MTHHDSRPQQQSRREMLSRVLATGAGAAVAIAGSIAYHELKAEPLNLEDFSTGELILAMKRLGTNGYVINVRDFGAQADGVVDDTKAFEHAINEASTRNVPIVFIPPGRYLLKGEENREDCIQLKSHVTLIGAGAAHSILVVNDSTQSNIKSVLAGRSVITSNIYGIGIRNESRAYTDDRFFNALYLRDCSNSEFQIETSYLEIGWLFDVNMTATREHESSPDTWGRGITFRGCKFTTLTEFHQVHDLTVVDCVWDIDLDALRPSWLRGELITAFKISGKNALQQRPQIHNGKIRFRGKNRHANVFQIFRAADFLIDGLELRGAPDYPSIVGSRTTKPKYGHSTSMTYGVFRNCVFNSARIAVDELADIELRDSRFVCSDNTGSNKPLVQTAYVTPGKVFEDQIKTSIRFTGCKFETAGTILHAIYPSAHAVSLIDCEIIVERRTTAVLVNAPSGLGSIEIVRCRFRFTTPYANYAVDVGGSKYLNVADTEFVSMDGHHFDKAPIQIGGSHRTVLLRTNTLSSGRASTVEILSSFSGDINVEGNTPALLEGSSAPIQGRWSVGTFVRHAGNSDSKLLGWVCVQAGSPGIWKDIHC